MTNASTYFLGPPQGSLVSASRVQKGDHVFYLRFSVEGKRSNTPCFLTAQNNKTSSVFGDQSVLRGFTLLTPEAFSLFWNNNKPNNIC